jgi:hypothetical protein
MDRDAARRDPARLASAATAIQRFFDHASRTLPIFDPNERLHEDPDSLDLADDVRTALGDRDWIEGYQAGLDDALRSAEGRDLVGPGATQSAYDGWSASPNRQAAYDAGRADGTTP